MKNHIYDRRVALGVTQKEVADAVGVSEATVSRWESGSIKDMRRDKIAKLAKVLRCSPLFIMTGEENQDEDERTKLKREFMDVFEKLNPESQKQIFSLAQLLLSQQVKP